ncbi:MAG TPA: iron-sulfur cluster repair di-iron protein [Puia sp.]|jgi:regulator of cell morphogenesis and NO signaling|nr:iron-sulfur cluster repair di-iron protein [Puia sp.]
MNTNVPNLTPEQTIGELAGKDYRKAEVFRKFGIDFCCGGGQTIGQACHSAGISEGELRSSLDLAELRVRTPEEDFQQWPTGKLAEYIVRRHHEYVRETAPVLTEYARKVAAHHGAAHSELIGLELRVRQTVLDLLGHMDREEKVLFPAVQELAETAEQAGAGNLSFVRHAILQMQNEHSISGEDLEGFRVMTHGYSVPEDACNSYRFLYEKLREFDLDLQQHIHLENNILFPKALALLDKTASE